MMRALALGARACIVGRSYIYGLGAGGQAGVAHAIEILRQGVRRDDGAVRRAEASPTIGRDVLADTEWTPNEESCHEEAHETPGPDHPITITPSRRARARHVQRQGRGRHHARAGAAGGGLQAGVLHPARGRADGAVRSAPRNSTHCPYKGDASYYTIKVGGRAAENAIWSYETPFPAMKEIDGHLAFYPNRVDAIEVSEA